MSFRAFKQPENHSARHSGNHVVIIRNPVKTTPDFCANEFAPTDVGPVLIGREIHANEFAPANIKNVVRRIHAYRTVILSILICEYGRVGSR